jgi:hypothetical protein
MCRPAPEPAEPGAVSALFQLFLFCNSRHRAARPGDMLKTATDLQA